VRNPLPLVWSKASSPLATVALALVFLAAATWVLVQQLQATTVAAIQQAVLAQPSGRIVLSLGLTAVSSTCLALYDYFAMRIVAPGVVRPLQAFFAGFAANAISNTLGFHVVTASAVRYRIYRRAGMTMTDVLRVISLSGLAIGLSYAAALAVALLVSPLGGLPDHITAPEAILAGIALVVLLTGLLLWLSRAPRSAAVANLRIDFPGGGIAAAQLGIGVIEMTASVAALFVLIPSNVAPPFIPFAIAVVIATAVGVISHTPGAIGVFEATTLLLMQGRTGPSVLAALLIYRIIYNIVPFVLAVAAFGIHEIASRPRRSVNEDRFKSE